MALPNNAWVAQLSSGLLVPKGLLGMQSQGLTGPKFKLDRVLLNVAPPPPPALRNTYVQGFITIDPGYYLFKLWGAGGGGSTGGAFGPTFGAGGGYVEKFATVTKSFQLAYGVGCGGTAAQNQSTGYAGLGGQNPSFTHGLNFDYSGLDGVSGGWSGGAGGATTALCDYDSTMTFLGQSGALQAAGGGGAGGDIGVAGPNNWPYGGGTLLGGSNPARQSGAGAADGAGCNPPAVSSAPLSVRNQQGGNWANVQTAVLSETDLWAPGENGFGNSTNNERWRPRPGNWNDPYWNKYSGLGGSCDNGAGVQTAQAGGPGQLVILRFK